MTTDIIELDNFIVLIEQSTTSVETCDIEQCCLDDNIIGFSFYGSGEVELEIKYGNKKTVLSNTTGIATSFFGNHKVEFVHKISNKKPLQCVSVFSTVKSLYKLPKQELAIFKNHLDDLMHAKDDFVEGPLFYMTPDMQNAVSKIFSTEYTGASRVLFLKSQITELLAHFFAQLSNQNQKSITIADQEKLHTAKEIISNNMVTPPTLSELSKMIGLNNTKLKKKFKELFGVPVFKYLQNERLDKAHELLKNGEMSIQEIAWHVGYESLGSFSNAFLKKFDLRPSEIKK